MKNSHTSPVGSSNSVIILVTETGIRESVEDFYVAAQFWKLTIKQLWLDINLNTDEFNFYSQLTFGRDFFEYEVYNDFSRQNSKFISIILCPTLIALACHKISPILLGADYK